MSYLYPLHRVMSGGADHLSFAPLALLLLWVGHLQVRTLILIQTLPYFLPPLKVTSILLQIVRNKKRNDKHTFGHFFSSFLCCSTLNISISIYPITMLNASK